jgi:hypothetical protein
MLEAMSRSVASAGSSRVVKLELAAPHHMQLQGWPARCSETTWPTTPQPECLHILSCTAERQVAGWAATVGMTIFPVIADRL